MSQPPELENDKIENNDNKKDNTKNEEVNSNDIKNKTEENTTKRTELKDIEVSPVEEITNKNKAISFTPTHLKRKDPRNMTRQELDEYLKRPKENFSNVPETQYFNNNDQNNLRRSFDLTSSIKNPISRNIEKSPNIHYYDIKQPSLTEKNYSVQFQRDIGILGLNFNYADKLSVTTEIFSTPIKPIQSVSSTNIHKNNERYERNVTNNESNEYKPSNYYNEDDFKLFSANEYKPPIRNNNHNHPNYLHTQPLNSYNFMSSPYKSNTDNFSIILHDMADPDERKVHVGRKLLLTAPTSLQDNIEYKKGTAQSIHNLQEQILTLTKENDDLKHKLLVFQNEKDYNMNQFKEQIDKSNVDLNCFMDEIKFHIGQNEELKHKLMNLARENDELISKKNEEKLFGARQIDDLKRRVTQYEFDTRELINNNEDLKTKKKKELDSNNKQIDDLKKKVFDLGVANDGLRREKHELEYFLSQTDDNKEKVFNTIKNLTEEKEEYQRKFLSETQRADDMQKKLETQIRILDSEKMELNRNVNELNRQLSIYETSIKMLEEEKARLCDFNHSEKESFKRKYDQHVEECEKYKDRIFHLNKDIKKLEKENRELSDDKNIIEGQVESLQKDIIEGQRQLGLKVNEYEDKIQIMLNKFNQEKKDLLNKYKILQNRVKFNEIEKADEIRKYENLVSNLSERLYKIEGKKYCYTKQFTKTMKIHDRAKSLGICESFTKLNRKQPTPHSSYKKITSSNNNEDEELIEDVYTYDDTKDKIEVEKKHKRYYSNKKEKERNRNNISANESMENEIYQYKQIKKKANYNKSSASIHKKEEEEEMDEVEALEKLIVELNKEYNGLYQKLTLALNESEIKILQKGIQKKETEIESEIKKLKILRKSRGMR